MALFDLPTSSTRTQDREIAATAKVQEHTATADKAVIMPVAREEERPAPKVEEAPKPAPRAEEELPQGAAAAELAAVARPRKNFNQNQAALPAPLVTAIPANPLNPEPHSYVSHDMPAPPPLGAPLAQAGVIMPAAAQQPTVRDDSVFDMLDLKSLPIPGLGSVQAAHAAALDMPVPTTPSAKSPFMPAEQAMPSTTGAVILPGAPPLTGNYGANQAGGDMGQISPPAAGEAPVPKIQPRSSTMDPNFKAQELARQQQDILMLRQQMDQRLKDLQTAEDKMKNMLREAKQLEDQKVKSLVQMYANMKPRMAAQALENMDERVAVRILNGMAPKQSGEILTYTNPAKTAKFTEMITRMRMGE